MISTRNAGLAAFEASLEWPPEWVGATSVAARLPDATALEGAGIRGSLVESCDAGITTVRGSLSCTEEEALRSVLDEMLRGVASVATTREAVLRTRVTRPGRAFSPPSGVVESLAVRLWRGGVRVGFGVSRSPATPGADIMVGCQGARRELVQALARDALFGMDRIEIAG